MNQQKQITDFTNEELQNTFYQLSINQVIVGNQLNILLGEIQKRQAKQPQESKLVLPKLNRVTKLPVSASNEMTGSFS